MSFHSDLVTWSVSNRTGSRTQVSLVLVVFSKPLSHMPSRVSL